MSKTKTDGVQLIAAERRRQQMEEGWTDEHDNGHRQEEMAIAGAVYAMPEDKRMLFTDGVPTEWPWADEWWKPVSGNRIRELQKAGALIAAEIDRLLRLQK